MTFNAFSKLFVVLTVFVILLGIYYVYILPSPAEESEVHLHADFKVYLHNNAIDFSLPKYQSNETQHLSDVVHVHDQDGNVLHVHAAGITMGNFLESVGISFSSQCLVTDDTSSYCTDSQNTLRFFVNGVPNSEFGDYLPRDLDRILITYGNESDDVIATQIASVTDQACIQSGTCPERGQPSDESSCTIFGCVVTEPPRIE